MNGRATPWRFVSIADPLPGSRNMAVDEYLLERAAEDGRTYLRFYRFAKPTLSFGCGQPAARAADLDLCRASGVDLVRRMTGGRAVLHVDELAYAIASADTGTFTPLLYDSCRLISRALIEGLSRMGLSARLAAEPAAACLRGERPCFAFASAGEVELDGRKIVGSAQRRRGGAFLQHGSIPLGGDGALLRRVTRFDRGGDALAMISLSEALARPVAFAWAAHRLADGFRGFFGVELEPFALDRDAQRQVERIEARRYGNDRWTFRR